MAITKFIKRQDSGFKLSEGNSGESSLNLSNEIFELLCPESIEAGKEKEITFKIFKDDFIKAICFIISKLPLYRSSSNSSIKVDYDYEVFKELQDNVESMFGPNKEADYTCTLLHRSDGRKYLKGLKVNGFSIRNYLVENLSALEFDNIGGSKSIRLLSGGDISIIKLLPPSAQEEIMNSNNIITITEHPFSSRIIHLNFLLHLSAISSGV